MMAKEKEIIKCPHLILCEGADAKWFLCRYLNSSALSDNPKFSSDIQVIDFGGNQELSNFLALMCNTDGFEQVKSIMIIRDSETNPASAIREISKALSDNNFPVPNNPHEWIGDGLQVGFTLFPTCDKCPTEGTLEDLCLSILSDAGADSSLQEVNAFLAAMENNHNRSFPRKFKNQLHTYFSSTDEYVSLKIGEAANAGAFNWDSPKLTPLRTFISAVF